MHQAEFALCWDAAGATPEPCVQAMLEQVVAGSWSATALACLRVLVGLFLARLLWTQGFSPRRQLLTKAEQRRQKAVTKFMQHTVHTVLLAQQDYSALLPQIDAARTIATSSSRSHSQHRLDCRASADGAFLVAALPKPLLRQMATLAESHLSKWAVDSVRERSALDALVNALLPYVDASSYGRPLVLADCIYCGLGLERGAPFPLIHTDTEWDLFPGCAGFQIWYLLALDSACPSQANMLLVDAATSTGADPPTAYYFSETGEVIKARNDGEGAPVIGPTGAHSTERVLGTYSSVDECAFSFRYLDLAPGECLLMNRHQLHMSDPRPHMAGRSVDRHAVTLRVVFKPPVSAPHAGAALVDASAPSYAGKALPRIFY